MNDIVKNILLWVVIAVILMMVFNNFTPHQQAAQPLEYSRFIADVRDGRVKR